MSTDCPLTFSQGIFLRPKLCSYQVIKLPVAGDVAGDYQAIIAVVGRMIGWSERTIRPPDGDLQNAITIGHPAGPMPGRGSGGVEGVLARTLPLQSKCSTLLPTRLQLNLRPR